LTSDDIDKLQEWGATVVRLAMFWEAVEMGDGDYDEKYLRDMEKLIKKLGKKGIYTIIDSH
jgi:aryl-phospho-beta-D-glucosidase BglC (GH1 family)